MPASERTGFQLDHAGMASMLQSSAIGGAMFNIGRSIQSTAQSIAPVRTGEYARSFSSRPRQVPTLSRRGGMSMRAGAEVVNDAKHAGQVEASRGVLSRAAKQARNR